MPISGLQTYELGSELKVSIDDPLSMGWVQSFGVYPDLPCQASAVRQTIVMTRHDDGLPQRQREAFETPICTCSHLSKCKWELQEDCNNLWSLTMRFDSDDELQSQELTQSLRSMRHLVLSACRYNIVGRKSSALQPRSKQTKCSHWSQIVVKQTCAHPQVMKVPHDFKYKDICM